MLIFDKSIRNHETASPERNVTLVMRLCVNNSKTAFGYYWCRCVFSLCLGRESASRIVSECWFCTMWIHLRYSIRLSKISHDTWWYELNGTVIDRKNAMCQHTIPWYHMYHTRPLPWPMFIYVSSLTSLNVMTWISQLRWYHQSLYHTIHCVIILSYYASIRMQILWHN